MDDSYQNALTHITLLSDSEWITNKLAPELRQAIELGIPYKLITPTEAIMVNPRTLLGDLRKKFKGLEILAK